MFGTVFSFTRAQAVDLSTADFVTGIANDAAFPHARGLYIGTAGALKIDTAGGDTVSYGNVAAGWLYVEATKVYKTGTTATNIVAHY